MSLLASFSVISVLGKSIVSYLFALDVKLTTKVSFAFFLCKYVNLTMLYTVVQSVSVTDIPAMNQTHHCTSQVPDFLFGHVSKQSVVVYTEM